MATCLIGLGSNLGEREQNLSRAIELLRANPDARVERVSRFHSSKPAGGPAGQAEFLNAAAVLESALEPPALLAALQDVENQLGRVRGERWGERVVDLDLLLYDRAELKTPTLELPHPRMSFRRFVLEPAAEIAPEMIYPVNGWTIAELLANLKRPEKYIAVGFVPSGILRGLQSRLDVRVLHAAESLTFDQKGTPFDSPVMRSYLLDCFCGFADARARLIDRHSWLDGQSWTISDFWFEDLELWAARYLRLQDMAVFAQCLQSYRSQIVSPKLVLFPFFPPDQPLPALELTMAAIERMRRRQETGPVLTLPADDEDRCVAEVLAAMQAME